jgi:outer membrane protein insertion porin family
MSVRGGYPVLQILLLATLVASRASAATIHSVSVSGNSAFSSREILSWLSSRPAAKYSRDRAESDVRTVVDRYREQGYLSTRAEFVLPAAGDTTSLDLVLTVVEGRQTVLGRLTLRGMKQMTAAELLERFETRPGDPLRQAVLERDFENILRRYETLGYPFARCSVAGMESHPGPEVDSLDVDVEVDEGERMTIDEVRIEGNRETESSVIVRETRLRFGEMFNPVKIDRIRERLNRLNIFASVAEPELYMRGTKGGILIKVQEGSTNTFDGLLGYVPASPTGGGGYVTGLAAVSMRNLFGTGRKIAVRWQREDRYTQELGVRYTEPWVAGLPINIGGGFLQRQQDSTYIRRSLDLKGELMLSEELSVAGVFSAENVYPSADTLSATVARSSTASFGIDLLYDTRDDLYSPTRGARYQTDYQYGTKKVTAIPTAIAATFAPSGSVQRLTIDCDFYLTTLMRQVLAMGVHGRRVQGGNIDESDMYRFGGATTLRGYRENQFLGTDVVWTNTEYRFLVGRRSFFYGFFDTGYYLHPADAGRNIPRTEAFKFGYGVGIRVDTPLGNMGVSFALGKGDTFGTAKIHVGLINDF